MSFTPDPLNQHPFLKPFLFQNMARIIEMALFSVYCWPWCSNTTPAVKCCVLLSARWFFLLSLRSDEIHKREHSNESCWSVLCFSAVYSEVHDVCLFWGSGWNFKVWLFTWKLPEEYLWNICQISHPTHSNNIHFWQLFFPKCSSGNLNSSFQWLLLALVSQYYFTRFVNFN